MPTKAVVQRKIDRWEAKKERVQATLDELYLLLEEAPEVEPDPEPEEDPAKDE